MGSVWARWGAGRAFYENRRPLVPEDSTEAAAEIEKNVELEMDGGEIGVLQVWDLHVDSEGASEVECLFLNNGCEKMNQTNVEESRDDFVVGNMMAFRLLYTQILWTFHLFDETFLYFCSYIRARIRIVSGLCLWNNLNCLKWAWWALWDDAVYQSQRLLNTPLFFIWSIKQL